MANKATAPAEVAVVDRSGVLAEALVAAANRRNQEEVHHKATGKKILPAYLAEIVPPDGADPDAQRLELSDRVRRGQLHAFVEISADVVRPPEKSAAPRVSYFAKSPALDDLRRWLAGPLNVRLQQVRLEQAGFSSPDLGKLLAREAVDGMSLVSKDSKTGRITAGQRASEAEAILAPMALTLMLFMMLMTGAMPLLTAVLEEKSSRIAEVLLGTVKPFEFMLGKVLGGVGVCLTASVIYVAAGIFALSQMAMESVIPYRILPWFFAYILMAVLMNGAMMAALGSMCSNNKDTQTLAPAALLPVLLPLFIMVPVIREPTRALWVWLSFFSPFTPVLMLLRQAVPQGVPLWQPFVDLLGLVLFTLFVVWSGGRVFRTAILMQGQPPSLANILRYNKGSDTLFP